MRGEDPRKIDDKDNYDNRVLPASDTDTPNTTKATAQNGRRRFLISLLRLRRVILQDAVPYLKPNSNGQTLSNSLLKLDVFSSEAC